MNEDVRIQNSRSSRSNLLLVSAGLQQSNYPPKYLSNGLQLHEQAPRTSNSMLQLVDTECVCACLCACIQQNMSSVSLFIYCGGQRAPTCGPLFTHLWLRRLGTKRNTQELLVSFRGLKVNVPKRTMVPEGHGGAEACWERQSVGSRLESFPTEPGCPWV